MTTGEDKKVKDKEIVNNCYSMKAINTGMANSGILYTISDDYYEVDLSRRNAALYAAFFGNSFVKMENSAASQIQLKNKG